MIGKIVVCLMLGYAFGCFSTGYFVGKLHHIDIRQYGSGNAGTTNALRTLGKKAGAMTFAGDVLKCIIPILLVRYLFFAGVEYLPLLVLYTAVGVVLGHNYPFYLRFKGGKGIAAMAAAILMFDVRLAGIALLLFVVVVAVTRYVSVGSLLVSALFPIWVAITYSGNIHMLCVSALFTISAFYMHRANIKRLMNGTENKIGQKVKVKTDETK